MKIVRAYPPMYDDLVRAVGRPGRIAVFTYGDTLYVPSGDDVVADVLWHEEVHSAQQHGAPDEWWRRYLADREFRLSQELEAYQGQYRRASEVLGRTERRQLLRTLSQDLASPIYGRLMTVAGARRAIASA